jgi:hypothetical protein
VTSGSLQLPHQQNMHVQLPQQELAAAAECMCDGEPACWKSHLVVRNFVSQQFLQQSKQAQL